MIKRLLIASSFTIYFAAASAQDNPGSYASYIENYAFDDYNDGDVPDSFFQVTQAYDITGKASIETPDFRGQRLRYAEGDVNLFYNQRICCLEEDNIVGVGIGYDTTDIFWRDNPFFRETHFNNVVFSLNGYSESMPCWVWKGGLSANVDASQFNWSHYAIYNVTLWGRYNYCDFMGIHIGIISETGIRKEKMVPILGVDFSMYDDWKVNLVYPVNMSIVYNLAENWSLAFAGKVFYQRHRINADEPVPKGIFEYRNFGTEVALTYDLAPYASANFHVGSALGGELKMSNNRGKNSTTVKMNQIGYIGWAVDFKF